MKVFEALQCRVQTKQKHTQKQSYKTHPLLPEMEATIRFSFVGPETFPIFSTWQHTETIPQHHPTILQWGWRSDLP